MKQALRILTVLLFLAPIAASGQDFEVVSPVSKKIVFNVTESAKYFDSTIIIQNISDSIIRVSYELEPNEFRPFTFFYGFTQHTFLAYPKEKIVLPLTFDATNMGGFVRSKLILSYNTHRDTVALEGSSELNCLSDIGTRKNILFTNIGIGEKVCALLKAENTTKNPINIYEVNNVPTNDTNNLVLDTLVKLPFVLLPGENVTLATLCYTATKSNEWFGAEYYINTSLSSYIAIDVSVTSSIVEDTNLEKKCIDITQESSTIGPIIFRGDTTHTLFFKSNRYDTLYVNDVVFYGGDGLLFKMVKPLPDTIPPLSLTPVKVRFSPTTLLPVVKDRFAVDARFTTSCGEFSIDLSALALQPTADSIATPLFPDKEYILGMSASAPSFSQDFHFVNNGPSNVKIVSVSLLDPSPEFAITGIQPTNTLPFTLAPSEKMSVGVLFTPSQVGKVFFNQLVITTEQGLQSVSFPIQALRTTTSSVKESSDPNVSISLVPNPATTSVTIKTENTASISELTMYDVLGKSVKTLTPVSSSECTFDIEKSLARGSYIIRIVGKRTDGKPFVASRQLVIE